MPNRLHFDISEWLVLDGTEAELPLTASLVQKIMQYHLLPANEIREALGHPVFVRSGWRPVWWEHLKDRDGDSQHCYKSKGATDLSIEATSGKPYKPKDMWLKFFRLLKETDYTRIAYYPDLRFFHCDYKTEERKYYISWQGWELSDYKTLADLVGANKNQNEGHSM